MGEGGGRARAETGMGPAPDWGCSQMSGVQSRCGPKACTDSCSREGGLLPDDGAAKQVPGRQGGPALERGAGHLPDEEGIAHRRPRPVVAMALPDSGGSWVADELDWG